MKWRKRILACLLLTVVTVPTACQNEGLAGGGDLYNRIHTKSGYTFEGLGEWSISREEIGKRLGMKEDFVDLASTVRDDYYDDRFMYAQPIIIPGISKEAEVVFLTVRDELVYGKYIFKCESKEEFGMLCAEMKAITDGWTEYDDSVDNYPIGSLWEWDYMIAEYSTILYFTHKDGTQLTIKGESRYDNALGVQTGVEENYGYFLVIQIGVGV